MANEHSGRRESLGLALQNGTTAATSAQIWLRQSSSKFRPKTAVVEDDSAAGVVESISDSIVDAKWAEGPMEGPLTDSVITYLLASIMGLPVTSDNADSNAIVKDHTFNVVQSNTPTYLTVFDKTPVSDLRHALAVVDTLTISGERGGFVTWKAEMKAKDGTATTSTVAYGTQYKFSMKDVFIKLASSVAGLSGATALELKRFEFVLERKSEPFIPSGTSEPSAMDTGDFTSSGEFVVRYNSTTHEDAFRNNTPQAFSLGIVNNDVTIGAAAHPGVVFTAPQTRFREFDRSDDLGTVVESTVGFKNELSLTDGYQLRTVVTNTQATVAAA